MTVVGDVINGKYQVIKLIGEGAMSRVWLVEDLHLSGKLWAVKEAARRSTDMSESAVIRGLHTEAKTMKGLDHPLLPRIVDIIEEEKALYVVMDYVAGESLNKVAARHGRPMPEKQVIAWGIQLCDALSYLHGQNPPIVHRDLKPGNIMLQDNGTVKIIDFGIARQYDPNKLGDTQVGGTRGYAAPEQSAGAAQTDQRADVYSLGATLFKLVTMRAPTEFAVLPPVRSLNPDLSEGLEHVILRATQPNPVHRYQSCYEMRADLENYEHLTWEYRSKQMSKVRKFNVMRALSAGLLAVGLACVGLSFYLKASTFESHMATARSASIEALDGEASAAEKSYVSAIEVDATRTEPYEALVNDVYKGDWNFTIEEAARWSALLTQYGEEISGSPSYAKLCYDTGILYYVYYEQDLSGDSRNYAMSGGVQAAQWFQRAVESYDASLDSGDECTLTAAERSAAATYVTIGQFYQKLSQGTLEGNEGSVYEGYWDSLEVAFDALTDEDAVMVKLRLYQLAHEAIESPTYLNGFRRAGVDRYRAESMLQNVMEATAALADDARSSEKSQEIYDEIMSGYDAAAANIEATYGNAALRSSGSAWKGGQQ